MFPWLFFFFISSIENNIWILLPFSFPLGHLPWPTKEDSGLGRPRSHLNDEKPERKIESLGPDMAEIILIYI